MPTAAFAARNRNGNAATSQMRRIGCDTTSVRNADAATAANAASPKSNNRRASFGPSVDRCQARCRRERRKDAAFTVHSALARLDSCRDARCASKPLEIGIDHHGDETAEVHLRLPAERRACLRGIADQEI